MSGTSKSPLATPASRTSLTTASICFADGEDLVAMLGGQVGELVLNDPRRAELLRVPAGEGRDDRHELGWRSVCTIACAGHDSQRKDVPALAELEQQILLAREVDIDAGWAHVGPSCDVAGARRVKPLVGKGIHGGIHQALDRVPCVTAGGRSRGGGHG
jgi:hypothetical protein